jgi:hypothetical protein
VAFKKIVSQELPMFFGNQQHDSQEFLSFLLEKMSDDLNRFYDDDEEEQKAIKPVEAHELNEIDGGTGGFENKSKNSTLNQNQIEVIAESTALVKMTANEKIYQSFF